MYSPLNNSYEWQILNKNGQATDKVAEALKTGTAVSFEMMPNTFSRLRNRLKSPIMGKIIDAVKDGSIQMVYTPQELRIPLYLPFILINNQNTKLPVGLVFLSNCGCTLDGDEYSCDEYKLKTSLESCFMALKFVELNKSPKLTAVNIVRPAAKIYAFMVAECINRKHSIKLDPETFNQVLFILSRFFIKTVMGAQFGDDQLDTYCLYNCTNPNLISIRRVTDQFTDADYANIATVLTKMASIPQLKNRLGKLTVSNFLESYINIYDAAMLLTLENFSYFVYNVISVLNSTYVNNYHVLKQIVGKDGVTLYSALITGICGA